MSMNSGRDAAVRNSPSNEDRKHTQPRTIQHMAEMKMFALEVGDENGVKRRVMAFKVGNTWYHDPAAEPFFDRLKPLDDKSWLATALTERMVEANTPVSAPIKDTVDIVGE